MKSATLLMLLVITFVSSKTSSAASLATKNCNLECLWCPKLDCVCGSYLLFRLYPCECCPTCITPKAGDACYYTSSVHNATYPQSCGPNLKCCNNSTCKENC